MPAPPHLLTALDAPTPTLADKLLLVAMGALADEDGVFRASVSSVARRLGLDRATCHRSLKRLERERWVRAALLSPGKPTHYRLHLLHCATGAAPPLPPDHPLHDLDMLRRLVRGHTAYQAAVQRGADPDDLFSDVLARLTMREGQRTRFDPQRASWSTYVHKVVHSVCSNTTRHRANHPEHHCTVSVDDMGT